MEINGLLRGYDRQYQGVFSSLGEVRLALLTKKLPLDPAGYGFLEEESLREWQNSLVTFLEKTDLQKKSVILALSDQIELEENITAKSV